MKKYMFAILLSILALANVAQANIIIGDSTNASAVTNGCYPFGCAVGNGEYEQKYLYNNFTNEINIQGLTFGIVFEANGVHATDVSEGEFTVTLAWVASADSPINMGEVSHSRVIYQGSLPELTSWTTYTIPFENMYFYDPIEYTEKGVKYNDLVMTVAWNNAIAKGYPPTFVSGTGLESTMTTDGEAVFQRNYGLQTTFTTVPEPSSVALIGLGALGFGALRRRRFAK